MRKEPTLSYRGSLARTLDEDGRKTNRSIGGLLFPLQPTKRRPADRGRGRVQERERAQVQVQNRWKSEVFRENPSTKRKLRG